MVNVLKSFGGYSQGGPILVRALPAPALSQRNQFTVGQTAYSGDANSLTPDTPPVVTPTFQVDWTRDTAVPGQLSLSRASLASYIGSDGRRHNAANNGWRLDYRSDTPAGLLIEAEQRTNNLLNCTDLNTGMNVVTPARSNKANSLTETGVNYIGDPNMVVLTAVAMTGFPPLYAGPYTGLTAGTYYIGVDAKAGTNNYATVSWRYDTTSATSADVTAVFDLTDGSVGQTQAINGPNGASTLVYAAAEYLGNGVYRLHLVALITTSGGNGNYVTFGMVKAKTGNTANVATSELYGTFDGTETILFQNGDIQLGRTPCSNIRTTSAAATRSGDIISSTNSDLIAATAWEIEVADVQIAAGATATLLGVNTVTGLGINSSNALTTADGGAQTTANTATWTDKNRAGIAWTGPAFNPTNMASIWAWFDPAQGITTVSGAVSQWVDAANGVTVAQATAGNRPTFSSTAINGSPGLTMTNAAVHSLTAATPNQPSNMSMVTIAAVISSAGQGPCIVGGSGTSSIEFRVNNNQLETLRESAASVATSTGAITSGSLAILAFTVSTGPSGTYGFRINGTADANSGANTQVFVAAPIVLFSNAPGANPLSETFNGSIGDIILTSVVSSLSDIQKAEGYLAWKYSLTSLLPSGHPYKNSAP